jgi:methionyl-tRNA formyltransferase
LTRPLRRSDGRLDPRRTATDLERQVRAYQPWPGTFLESDGGRIVVWHATVGAPRGELEVGTLRRDDSGALSVVAADALLVLDEVQPAGGRRMSAAELLRGRPALDGATLPPPADAGT